jgi:hypothetical protein
MKNKVFGANEYFNQNLASLFYSKASVSIPRPSFFNLKNLFGADRPPE